MYNKFIVELCLVLASYCYCVDTYKIPTSFKTIFFPKESNNKADKKNLMAMTNFYEK